MTSPASSEDELREKISLGLSLEAEQELSSLLNQIMADYAEAKSKMMAGVDTKHYLGQVRRTIKREAYRVLAPIIATADRSARKDERSNEKAPISGAASYSLRLNTVDYSTIFDTLKDYALKLVANAHSEMTDEQWSEYVNEQTVVYAKMLHQGLAQLRTDAGEGMEKSEQ